LGIGWSSHIDFNEPFCSIKSRNRLIALDKITRSDAQAHFGVHKVPKLAITMGIAFIMLSKIMLLMGFS